MIEPNQYGTEDIQNELLDIMKLFHKHCEENGIQYFLHGGSCLGAIRHKGFIPWDDDLDIIMDRKNYNKLVSCFDSFNDLNIHRTIWIYRVQKNNATPIRGYIPTLDIFVFDNAPDVPNKFKNKTFRLAMLQGMLKEDVSYEKVSLKYKICLLGTHVLGKLFSVEALRNWYDKISQIGNDTITKNVHITNTGFRSIHDVYPSDTWNQAILTEFEDTQFYIPKNYDTYLSIKYGDYMKLPDEKQRKAEHTKEG